MEEYRSTLNEAQLFSAATIVCTAGQYNRIGEYKILAGELLALGFGTNNDQSNAIGRIYILMNVAGPTEVPGYYRITQMSASDRPGIILWESRTEITNANPTDRTKQVPLNESPYFIGQDKRIAFDFMPDATATVTKADSKIRLDVTKVAV
jgi:hypothetical protein